MALIAWKPELATGHPKIDEQHQSLIDAFNRLHNAMKLGKGKDELGGTLVFLRDYTVSHFKMEEELMDRSAYPGAPRHKTVHRELVTQVADLVDKFQKGTGALTLPVMDFLEKWLTNHIQGEDMLLADHLRGQGSKG
jgi:hemerythrin-like metal-binding protein